MPSTINATPTSSGLVQSADASGVLALQTGGTTAVTIDGSQNVGIGTSSPVYKLDVRPSFGLTGAGIELFRSGGLTSGNGGVLNFRPSLGTTTSEIYNLSIIAYDHNGDSNADGLSINGSDGVSFCTGSNTRNERMRIDSSGSLLVGRTTNPWSVRLLVESTGAITNLRTTSTTATAVEINVNSSNTSQKAVEVYSDSNNERSLTIWSNGNVINKNNSYGAISDIKLKENIVNATPKLEELCQVKVRNFNYIGNETKQIGVVAQELEQVFPSMIDESPDTDREGTLLETTTKSVKYSVFVPMLIKAIQELKTIVDQQKTELDSVKAELAVLKAQP